MDNSLKMVIGMSLAYITSFAGLLLAYFSYKKHRKPRNKKEEPGQPEISGKEAGDE